MSDAVTTNRFSPGHRIGPYELVQFLGRGTFGEVWLAERDGDITKTRLALKLPVDLHLNIANIRREAELWVKVGHHPNVLALFEATSFDGQIVIASEYAPDGSLYDWLESHGGSAPSVSIALELVTGILRGLEHLHTQGVVHRDLKPANILMQHQAPRLADFGLARVLDPQVTVSSIAGTPSYMGPEAFSGSQNPCVDIWSVGVILYQLLSGRLPFPQKDWGSLVQAVLMQDPDPLPSTLPGRLRDVVGLALRKDSSQRFSTASQMKNALSNLENQDAIGQTDRSKISGWGTFISPDDDCAWTVKRGTLTVFVPGKDHDLGVERGLMNAPRIVQEITGDFVIQVCVSCNLYPMRAAGTDRHAFQGAGILIVQDDTTYIILEYAYVGSDGVFHYYTNYEIRLAGKAHNFGKLFDAPLDEGKDTFLRIERIGDRLFAAVSQNETRWTYLETKTLPLSKNLAIGVAAVNTSTQAFAPEFRNLRIFCDNRENQWETRNPWCP